MKASVTVVVVALLGLATVTSANAANCEAVGTVSQTIAKYAQEGRPIDAVRSAATTNNIDEVGRKWVMNMIDSVYGNKHLVSGLTNANDFGKTQKANCYAQGVENYIVTYPVIPYANQMQPQAQQADTSSGVGEFFGALLGTVTAIATPLANGYVDQRNENARNAAGRRSAPNYICTPAGGGSATCTSY